MTQTPRISFNGGFHDAQNDRRNGRDRRNVANHFNPYYATGYLYGWAHDYADSSEPAWKSFRRTRAANIRMEKDERTSTYRFRIESEGLVYWSGGHPSRRAADHKAMAQMVVMIAGSLIEI